MNKQQTVSCPHCQSEFLGNFCVDCGRPKTLKRIDRKYLLSEIGSVINFDKGILYTIKELLIKPGENIQNFIDQDRNRLVKPVIFVVICSLVYTIAQYFLHFEDGYVSAGGFEETATSKIFNWIQNNYGYANILMAIFISLWIKIFFRKSKYNFFEILILLCFVMGMGMLIYTLFGIIESITQLSVLHLGGMIGLTYAAWAIARFFNKKKKINYLKAGIAYLLGMVSFTIAAILVGSLIDLLNKI